MIAISMVTTMSGTMVTIMMRTMAASSELISSTRLIVSGKVR
jgi:hypothetical protein